MEVSKVIAFIESERLKAKLHKTKMCSKASISVTYYNKLLSGVYSPGYDVIKDLLATLGYRFLIIPEGIL